MNYILINPNDNYYTVNYVMLRWFHGKISREMAEDLLTPKENGLFLVRESTNYPGDYTLCVCYLGKVEHYRVKYKDNQLTIDDEEFFENLSQLVEVSYYYNTVKYTRQKILNIHTYKIRFY